MAVEVGKLVILFSLGLFNKGARLFKRGLNYLLNLYQP